MTVKVYNFYKEGDEICEDNTRLLKRLVGFQVEDIVPEERVDLVDLYEVFMTPTTVFLTEEGDVIAKLTGKVTVDKLNQIFDN